MAWPRLCALAEVLWSPRETRDAADFTRRLETHLERLRILDVNFWRPRR
jgi:hexosaminidase